MDAAQEHIKDERERVVAQLHAAGLLVEDWSALDQLIAELDAQGIIPLDEPIDLPPSARPSELLIDEDRGAY